MGRMKNLLVTVSIELANKLNSLYSLEVTEDEASEALLSHPHGTSIIINCSFHGFDKSVNIFNYLSELKNLINKEREI